MIFSYAQAKELNLPFHAKAFLESSEMAPDGMVFGPQAMDLFLDSNGLREEAINLTKHVTDGESQKRVDEQIRNHIITAKIPDNLASAITEAVEVLSLEEDSLQIKKSPLIVILFCDNKIINNKVLINIVGRKELADALRVLWSRVFTSPYPPEDIKSTIVVYKMPLCDVTAQVNGYNDIVVRAGFGWGCLVGVDESCDEYHVKGSPSRVTEHMINIQNSMIAYNPRSGQVIQTKPSHGAVQKVNDSILSDIVRKHRKIHITKSVFGIAGNRVFLLDIPLSAKAAAESINEETAYDNKQSEDDKTAEGIMIKDSGHSEDSEEEIKDEHIIIQPEEEAENISEGEVHEEAKEDAISTEHSLEYETQENISGEATKKETSYEETPYKDKQYKNKDNTEEEISDEIIVEDYETQKECTSVKEESDAQSIEGYQGVEDTAGYEEAISGDESIERDIQIIDADDDNTTNTRIAYGDENNASIGNDEKASEEISDDNIGKSSKQLRSDIKEQARRILDTCTKTIEARLREWLYNDDRYDDPMQVIEAVASKRLLPYKQRIITLFQMKEQRVFDDPSAEDVRFGLETVERFLREFQ